MTNDMTGQPITAEFPRPEFSRTVAADKVGSDEATHDIEASAQERRALAKRFDLQGIDSLTATLHVKRVRGGQMIRVRGSLEADVIQTCVVTLEPVRNHVSEEFETMFAPHHLIPETATEVEIDPDAEEPPELLVGNRIDIGELTAQHLSLALDPYPRAPEAGFEDLVEEEYEAEPERPNPFQALAKLKPPH